MTTTAPTARPRIMSRALAVRFVSIVASSAGFFLPLSALPLFAEAHAPGSAGVANGALLIACVAGELATPWVLARVGMRATLAAGLTLLGLPLLVLLVMPTVPAMIAVGVLRGIGFALAVVAGGALTASLLPAERRGEGLALVGLVAGVPSFLSLPLGVWMAQQWGFASVLVAAAVIPVLGVVTVPWLPRRRAESGEQHGGLLTGLRRGSVLRPAMVFFVSAAAAGVVVTFVPLQLAAAPAWLAPAALLVQSVAATAGRWVAGRIGDRRGTNRLLIPGILLVAIGIAGLALGGAVVPVIAGAVLFGTGFGVLQNATIVLMYARTAERDFGVISAIWNAAYDGGMAVGSIAVGVLSAAVGYGPAFLFVAVVVAATLVLVRRERGTQVVPASAAA
jgi:predicted MFS family arabinose efflux permease